MKQLCAKWHGRSLRALCALVPAALLAGLVCAPALAAATRSGSAGAPQASASPASQARPKFALTQLQASEEAKQSGKPVPVTGATTPDSTLTANPNGTFSVTESAGPVRAKVGGVWRSLDANLARNSNGTFSPEVSSQPLTLSGGGTGPVATMTYGAYSMALTAPMRLPAPAITGNTATYRDVLPGVSLVVSARPTGGVDESLVVASAAAAANPALRTLTFTTRLNGLTLQAGRHGTIDAVARDGEVIFAAPQPRMWNSAVSSAVKTVEVPGLGRVSKATGLPAFSSVDGPGASAKTAPIGFRLGRSSITLTPDLRLLGSTGPFYLDPWFTYADQGATSWAYVSSQVINGDDSLAGQSYYDTSLYLQVGQNPAGGTSFSYYTLPMPSIKGADIDAVTANFPEVWSYTCNGGTADSEVELYNSAAISASTTYNNRPKLGASPLGSDEVAYDWSSTGDVGGPSSCGSGVQDVSFSGSALVSEVQNSAVPGGWPTFTAALVAADTTDSYGWKLFANPASGTSGNDQGGYNAIGGNASWTITYAYPPAEPTLSTTGEVADCTSGGSTLGNGNVTLDATEHYNNGDQLENGFQAVFTAYAAGDTADSVLQNSSGGSVSSLSVPFAISGTTNNGTAPLALTQTQLDKADSTYGGTDGEVKITWTAEVSLDGMSSTAASCSFEFSTAIPGEPVVTDAAGNSCGISTPSTLTYTVGKDSSFTLAPNASSTVEPTSYTYQLNGGNPVTVSVSSSDSYTADVSIAPTRITDVLIVSAVAAGGNIGQPSYCTFSAVAPAVAVDQDMTGDGIPDLVTVGSGTTGTASGLWLADGQASGGRFDGTVDTTATDVAPNGPQDVATPSSWNGLKAFTGQFSGPGFNDVEAYQPGTGDTYILPGEGDGSVVTSQPDNLTDTFQDINYATSSTGNTNYAEQLVSAYNVSCANPDEQEACDNQQYPDEIGQFTDPDIGPYLAYFANSNGVGDFDSASQGLPYELSNTTPDGTMDWNDWTITTDQDTRGGTTYTDMWLWNSETGALYLWELTGLDNVADGGQIFSNGAVTTVNPTATLTYTQTAVTAGWPAGTTFSTFQATDIDGNPGLIAVTATGQVESWADESGTMTQVNATGASQALLTATHSYPLNDALSTGATGGTEAGTADDQSGTGVTPQNLAGNTGTTWSFADPTFSPDVLFNPTDSGYMTTSSSSGLLTPDKNFTISAWVDPSTLGGMVLSQDGSSYSTIEISSTTSGAWQVGLENTTGNSYVTATGGTAAPGMWTNVVVTYDVTGGADILKLYADGVEVAYASDTSVPSTTGDFLLGANDVDGTVKNFLSGQMADVQVWNSLAAPIEPGTSPSAFVPISPVRIMDTRPASQVGATEGPVASAGTVTLPIDGSTTSGVDLPSSGITAVAVAVTVTQQQDGGWASVYPSDTPRPTTSTINFLAGITITNNTIVPVGPNGAISIYNGSAGTVNFLVDITGYFTTDTAATGASTYTPLADPTQILDTKTGEGAPEATIGGGATLTLAMAGDTTSGVDLPSSGLTAVALNLTEIPTASGDDGYLTVYPDGISRPGVSELLYDANDDQSQANTILVPVDSDGKIDIYNGSGTAINLIGTVEGYFTTSTTGQYYHPIDSTRLIDTRNTAALGSDATLNVANPASVLANNPTLVLNITVTEGSSGGWLGAYPGTATNPMTSILDYDTNDVANLALVRTAGNNSFNIYNGSGGTVDVVIDVNGYFE